ncbi:MAG TPA: pyridoxal-phosphate dependent enzyme [Virgibacillus sp.]|nr:pyridoxal-phosphate dependent enzyme [Virgibacillus sp.]
MSSIIELRDVWQAKQRIKPIIESSPLIYSRSLSERTQSDIYLKLENLNVSASFKVRGAANKILHLSKEERARGVITFSTGNFGLSVAYVAKRLGIKSVICISKRVPREKVDLLRQSGAEIIIKGESQDEAERECYKREQYTVIHPFDDTDVIAGQGTIGLEILEDLPEVDTVIGGLSGGGLHSGLGLVLKKSSTSIKLIGISTEAGPTMYNSIQAGKPVVVTEEDTLADSLLGGIGRNNRYTFSMVSQFVDDIILVNETTIANGMRFMLQEQKMVIEGAAGAGVGAVLAGNLKLGGTNVLLITGGQVDPSVVLGLLNTEEL